MTLDLLSEEQVMIGTAAKEFASARLAPTAAERDRDKVFPREIMREMGDLGFLGMLVPEEWGGVGADHVSYVLALEEISAGDGSIGGMMALHNGLISTPLLKYGTEEQKRTYLTPLVKGQMIGAFGLTEPEAGSNAFEIKTRARKSNDGYIVSGVKQFMSNGKSADFAILFAATNLDDPRNRISAFIIPTRSPGYSAIKVEDKLGLNASETCQVVLEDVHVTEDQLLGREGDGYRIAMSTLEIGRIGIAAQSLGIARSAYDLAAAYAKERSTFGKKIIEHQAVGFRLADMAMHVEVARAFLHRVARLRDLGKPCRSEAAMAKLFASEMAERVCSEAIQVHGGYGYLKDFAVERIFRDSRVCRIYEGTSDIQRMIIAREIAKAP